MATNTLFVFIVVCFMSTVSLADEESDEEFSRKDYTYIEAVNSFYKIHTAPQNWFDAKLECEEEGASLFYSENEDEQNAVMLFRNTTQPDVKWVFMGISDLSSEGVFQTVDGNPLSEVYSNWKSDEPNDADGEEDCVEQDNMGKMNDVKCTKEFSFICKKRLRTVKQNNSKDEQSCKEFAGKGYTYIEALNSFYKIHRTPHNWFDAKLECEEEGASLFYPENDNEQSVVMSFRNSTQPDVKSVYVGISDLLTEGVFQTVDGKSLSEVYSNWKSDEPNDANGEEDCVEQDNVGKMNDVKCSQKFSFICKKRLPTVEQMNIDGQSCKELAGKDYTYIEAVNSFYKIHTTLHNWFDAKLECEEEGASLFYPENDDEQNAVMTLRNTTQPDVKWVFMGISDLSSEGIFQTVDGKLLSEVYSNWKSDEPNNANGEEDCVEQDNVGKMNDVKCSQKFSFICKKKVPTVEQNNSCNIDGQSCKEFAGKDYTYIEAVNNFYKIHRTPHNWIDATLECEEEGASLFYPENDDEQSVVMSFQNSTQPDVKSVYVGVSDLLEEGVFQTVDGKPLSEVYNNWKSDEPNDADGEEDCVEQDNMGKMNDVKCSRKLSFICKKILPTVEQNNSCNKDGQSCKEFAGKDYTFIEAVNSFYKIHTTPHNWFDAKLECEEEGASLFYPENDDEQNAVMSFRNTTQPDVKWVFMGISDLSSEGVFQTVNGKPLSEVYSNWKSDEPNDANGEEDCVEQDNVGKMNDVKCSQRFSFICKKRFPPQERNKSSNTDDKVFLRKDYTYLKAVNSMYKIHTAPQNWRYANMECAREGASLFYPENEDEQNAVMLFRNTTEPNVKWVFVGISDQMVEGSFVTIDGKPLSEVYNNWKPNEPNNNRGVENCVEQDNTGKMNDVECTDKFSFICRKKLPSPEQKNSSNIDGQKDKDFFRKDYTYIETVNSFYKIHTTPQNWSDAKLQCDEEGASLFYPENDVEQNAVLSFRNTTQPSVKWVFVGISDLMTEGVFETIDGKPVSDVYSNWKPNEPNDNKGAEDCVEQDNAGKMNDVKCSEEFSFICKKKLVSQERINSSNIDGQKDKVFFRKDYTYIEAVNSFYKIHTAPQNWSDAKLECEEEGTSLFYPENDDEQNAVMSFRNTTQPDVKRVFVGISYLTAEREFETIDGKSLSDVYNNWKLGEPSDDSDENCVELDNLGEMSNSKCSEQLSFICKSSLQPLQRNNNNETDEQKDKQFFRTDYTYIAAVNNFYKIHTTAQNWFDAKLECAQEGANLFFAEDDDEQNAVMSLRNATQPDVKRVFVGISNLTSEGEFETIDGRSVYDVYNKWRSHELNDDNGEECVEQDDAGEMSVCNCSVKLSFICKKSLVPLERNTTCNIGYSFDQNAFKCYKLHTTSLKWAAAYVVCRAEEGHLAVINNKSEADYLAMLIAASKQRIGGHHQLYRGIYHLGFHYRFREGWQTVRGTPFKVDDGIWWDNNQPIIDENAQCGSMFYTGRLHSVDCDTESFFICEHEVVSSHFPEEIFQ